MSDDKPFQRPRCIKRKRKKVRNFDLDMKIKKIGDVANILLHKIFCQFDLENEGQGHRRFGICSTALSFLSTCNHASKNDLSSGVMMQLQNSSVILVSLKMKMKVKNIDDLADVRWPHIPCRLANAH